MFAVRLLQELTFGGESSASIIRVTKIGELCKFRGFYGGDYEEWRLLGCYAVWLL
jgi:hypothetical protein